MLPTSSYQGNFKGCIRDNTSQNVEKSKGYKSKFSYIPYRRNCVYLIHNIITHIVGTLEELRGGNGLVIVEGLDRATHTREVLLAVVVGGGVCVAGYLGDLDVPEAIVCRGVGCIKLKGQDHLKGEKF